MTDPYEERQRAGIEHLLSIARQQHPETLPLPVLPPNPGVARGDQLATWDAETSAAVPSPGPWLRLFHLARIVRARMVKRRDPHEVR